ncbi:MAG TPA: RIP metalloprotease RseP [Gammaproteobacteria bacterium]|nr:RIP metalloprotease RseP [Gammaproteobacteria bacterium]
MSLVIWSILGMVVALGLLVTIHELGHFVVARRAGVLVERFSVGFGRPLFRWRRAGDPTEYVVAMIPLGGYVKMFGETDQAVAPGQQQQSFSHKTLGWRAAIVTAGPLANFLLAILLFWILYMVGVSGFRPMLGELDPQSIAVASGFAEGDQIRAINREPVVLWEEVGIRLLGSAVEKRRVEVEVVTAGGYQEVRWIDFQHHEQLLEEGDLLDRLGLEAGLPKLPPVVAEIVPGEAAERAGLRSGDQLLLADGEVIEDWRFWVDYVRARPGVAIDLQLRRQGQLVALEITPAAREEREKIVGRIGAAPQVPEGWYDDYRATRRYGPVAALGEAVTQTAEMSLLTLKMLGKMVVGEASLKNINGPISIAEYAGRSARVGLSSFLKLVAVLSISIAILNLLPIPVLDGGHLLYYFVEWVKGGPLSEKWRALGQQGGVVILLCLTALALYNDVQRLLN